MSEWVLATGAAAAVVALLTPGAATALPVRSAIAARPRARVPRRMVGGLAALLAAAVAAAAAGPDRRATTLGLAAVLAVAVAGGLRLAALGRRTARARQRREQVLSYLEALVGELQAGRPPSTALARAGAAWPEGVPVATAARLGGHVPTELRRIAARPGAGELTRLAAAWELTERTGAGLAWSAQRVLDGVRAELALGRAVDAELASARATARLVCGLPVVVLTVGQGAGARPWQFLLTTLPGIACLGSGLLLAIAGLLWVERIGAQVSDPPSSGAAEPSS